MDDDGRLRSDRDPPIDSDAVRAWISRVATMLGIGIPVALIGISIVTGEDLESIIWNGIMGGVLGMIVMYGISPQSFSLFPPGRHRRDRRR